MKKYFVICTAILLLLPSLALAQKYVDSNGNLRIALAQQPFSPRGTSQGPNTMANGGIQDALKEMGAVIRVTESGLTPEQEPEYGGWKRLGMSLGHFGKQVAQNERDGYFNVGLFASCPSLSGMLAGMQHSGPTRDQLSIGLLWLDSHADFNTPETTRSGGLGGMPVAVAAGRCLHRLRMDAGLDPPISEKHIIMGGVRLWDPLERSLVDNSFIELLSVDDLKNMTPAVTEQLDRLTSLTDKLYVHIDMDVLDPKEVMGHGNKVPNGPSSQELARLFEMIFSKYPTASGIGFATIPSEDEGGLSLQAVNRMILGAVKGLQAR